MGEIAAPPNDELKSRVDWQGVYSDRAYASVQELLKQHRRLPPDLQSNLQQQLAILTGLQTKLSQRLIQIAAFGFVSRGKSAVLNALFGEPVFSVGPLNGETQWPRSVRWSPVPATSAPGASPTAKVQIELIDTPGLDEIEDQGRATMARDIAQSADLILFIVAGTPTPLEIDALMELQQVGRPFLMVVNKADLYPNLTAAAIHQALKYPALQQLLSPEEILLTAAAPAPVPVRIEWPDGRTDDEWEVPPPQIEALRASLLDILNREGRYLLTLNAMLQAQAAEQAIAQRIGEAQAETSAALIWRFVQIKAVAVALNPLALLDVLGSSLVDLLLIGTLVKRHGLPTTRYRVSSLWQALLISCGGLTITEMGSGLLSGFGNGLGVFGGMEGLLSYGGTMLVQAGAAAYGAYHIGQTTQQYLIQGATWGPLGPSTIVRDLLNSIEPDMILDRLRHRIVGQFTPASLTVPDN